LERHGRRGQTVPDDDLEIGTFGTCRCDRPGSFDAEPPTEVRAPEVFHLGGGPGRYFKQLQTSDPLFTKIANQIDLGVNGIPGGGVVGS
jgi:hypothetical protein